ncbi:MAG: phage holin family protein [Oscillospiraceae bacterium]|nr:phage holin family protein [Oscillospiraceae bacterium]
MLIGWKGIMILAWVVLMALDYLTGTWAAMMAGEWCSKKAREGAWHKLGAIVVIVVSIIADGIMLVICGNLPMLHIAWPGVILPLMLAWYILTELGSILENAIKMGANPPAWLSGVLAAGLKAVENAGDNALDLKNE